MMNRIELETAVSVILENTAPVKETRSVSVLEAGGRVLAEDFYAPIDNPPFPRSPLDGYALRSADTKGAGENQPVLFKVADTVYAGGYSSHLLAEGEAVRIMTGAPIPAGADCVIRQEDVRADESGQVQVYQELKPYENYCFTGEDVRQGTLLLKKGRCLGHIEQAVLSSCGKEYVTVYRRLRAALLVTGDELISPGEYLNPGKIYDSNLQLLYGRMQELGITPVVAGYRKDDPKAIALELGGMAKDIDVVVTTGGVSVGAKDIFHEVIPILGSEQKFWGIQMKPGTPAMFCTYEGIPMLHLSGNPFAALTTFELLGRPMLAKMTGNGRLDLKREKAVLAGDFDKASPGRRFLRGKLAGGQVVIPPTGKHASGMLISMLDCNCLIDVPADSGPLKAGMAVEVVVL